MIKRLSICGFLVVLASAIGLFVFTRAHAAPGIPPTQTAAAEKYWEARIHAVGGEKAYVEFGTSVARMDAGMQHGLAHAFGGALYAAAGLPGIVSCDAQFSYGCYHQFVGSAIAAQGLGVISNIVSACEQIDHPGPCLHGIGHGLVGFLGYAPEALEKSIGECESINANVSLQACDGGAFMEYNMRTLADNGLRRPTSDLYAPCDSYSGDAAKSCYLYQGQWWWSEVFGPTGGATSTRFATMAKLCTKLSGDTRALCNEGVGLMAPPAGSYHPEQATALCDVLSGNDRAMCLSGAAVVFNGTGHASDADAVCSALNSAERAGCMQYASGEKIL